MMRAYSLLIACSLAVIAVLSPVAAFAGQQVKTTASAPLHMNDPNLFRLLTAEPRVRVFHLGSDWPFAADSSTRAAKRPLDRVSWSAERLFGSKKAIEELLDLLARCTWTRAAGWSSAMKPSLGLRFGPDSLGMDLLVSLEGRNAILSSAREGSASAELPESLRTTLSWCLWGIDPENSEALALMRQRGLDPEAAPSREIEFLSDFVRPLPSPVVTKAIGEPPHPIEPSNPVYPEMAKEAKIEGRVVLYALVGADGHVKQLKVIHSVNYLDDAAKGAVSRWTFEPGRVAGEPVESWVEVPVEFHLP